MRGSFAKCGEAGSSNAAITLRRPHRDDIALLVDGADLRRFGSQGQQRTAALTLQAYATNTRLKKAVADLTLDKLILKEALEGNY